MDAVTKAHNLSVVVIKAELAPKPEPEIEESDEDDIIYVGGSTFVVADFLLRYV